METSTDESALWHRFQQGDSDALGRLMAMHYPALFHYGSRFTRNTDSIRDGMQDVFVELWNRRENLRLLATGQVKPYLMTMLRRLLHEQPLDQEGFTLVQLTDESAQLPATYSPEEQLITDERHSHTSHRIRQLIDRLPPRAREAVHLRFFDNLDRVAVAQIMGISEQSVSNLLQEAFRLLRQRTDVREFLLQVIPFLIAHLAA